MTHRNFLDKSCVQVAVYDDRVEITSPGMLYGGLTIEQIKEGGSKIRNRCIAEVFSRMRIIESWGTGIKRMIASCREYGIREPESQQKIVGMVLDNPKVTQAAMAKELNITPRAVKKSIKELMERGVLERIGSAKGGYWKVVREKGKNKNG